MSNAIPFVDERQSFWRRWIAISWLGAVGMALGLFIFYKSHTMPLMLLGLLIFSIIAVLQTDMAVLAVVATAPLFLIPAELIGIRQAPVRLPLHEVALLVSAGAVVARWLGGYVWRGGTPRKMFSGALPPVVELPPHRMSPRGRSFSARTRPRRSPVPPVISSTLTPGFCASKPLTKWSTIAVGCDA